MNSLLTLFHGTQKIIYEPSMSLARKHNDYGPGFYLTEDEELAKEWAGRYNTSCVVCQYLLHLDNLKVLDLSNKQYSVLNWFAILLKFREFKLGNAVAKDIKEFILKKYYIDVSKYDVVIGHRADDSYFSYAQAFVNNAIPLELLERAIKLGNLGTQVALISEKAFKQLHFLTFESVDQNVYYAKFKERDNKARNEYLNLKTDIKIGTFATDLIRRNK